MRAPSATGLSPNGWLYYLSWGCALLALAAAWLLVRGKFGRTLRAYLIGMFSNNFLPTGFGGGVLPSRGAAVPNRAGGGSGFGGASAASSGVNATLAYVEKHGATKRFALIVSSEQEAAPYVIEGDSVAAMGGFTGRETVLTHAYLAALVGSASHGAVTLPD